jgi:hypothetical protein
MHMHGMIGKWGSPKFINERNACTILPNHLNVQIHLFLLWIISANQQSIHHDRTMTNTTTVLKYISLTAAIFLPLLSITNTVWITPNISCSIMPVSKQGSNYVLPLSLWSSLKIQRQIWENPHWNVAWICDNGSSCWLETIAKNQMLFRTNLEFMPCKIWSRKQLLIWLLIATFL